MMPTTREFLGDSLIKELEGAGFSPQSINAFAKNEYRQRKAAQEEEQRRLLYRADDMKLDGKTKEAFLSGDINEQEAKNAQKFEEFGAKKYGWALGAAKTVTGIANTVERVGDFINPFYEGKHDKDGNYIYQNGLEKSLRSKIKNVEKMRDDYEKATGETSWGSRLSEIGTEMVGDPINFVGGVGLLSKGSKLAQFGKKTLYFAGTGAASGGVAALGEGKNDEETLKNIGYGAAGGAFLGHAIDQGIQGISKLIAKRQASKMANEADAIDNAQNSEFLAGSSQDHRTTVATEGKLSNDRSGRADEATNTAPLARGGGLSSSAQTMTAKEFATKEVGLDEDTATNVLKEAMQGKEKSEFIDADSYNDIVKFKNFEVQREYAKAYGEKIQTAQTSINNAREQSAIRYADTQKAIGEYQKQGMSASAIRELINAKFKPSADEIDYTRAYNDGADVDARLTGQGIFYALEKDIAAYIYTPEQYFVRLKSKGCGDEQATEFTHAYVQKDINIAKEYVNEKVANAYESRVQREVADEIKAKNEVEDVGLAVRDGEAIDKPEIYEGNNIMDFSSKIDDNFLRENATELEPSGNLFDFLAKTKNNPSRDKILNHFADKAGEGDSRLLEHRMAYLNYIMPTIKEPLIKIFRSDGRISNIKPFVFTDANSKTKNVNFLSIVTDKDGNIDFITAYALKDKSQLRSEIKKGIKVEVRRGLARTFDPHSRIQVPNATKNIIPQKGNLINEEAKNSALPNGVSGIGDNASGAGGRQGGDEEILRQSGRNTADASEEKWTAKSDRQMEQRPAFKTDGDTDATASSKQMVEKQGRDDNEIKGENFITKQSPAPKSDLNVKISVDDWVRELGGINANKQIKADLAKLYEKHKELFAKPSDVFRLIKAVKENPTFFYNNNEPNTALIGKILDNGKLGKIGIQKDYDSEYLKLNHATYSSKTDKENKRLLRRNENSHLVGSPTPTQLTLGKATEPTADGAKALLDEIYKRADGKDAHIPLHTDTMPAGATGANARSSADESIIPQKEINAKTINANSHIASGLVGGTLNSIDEDGNFNPEKFAAGFIAGLAGSKAVAIAARKMTPQLYNKILGVANKMPQMAKDNPKLLGKLYQNAKDASLNSFAGEKAITANVGKLDQAKAMLEKGADEVEIWQKTGWFKDKDGAWKFEIGDSKARLNPNFKSGGRLGELLEHEELFKAYPELKDVSVKKINDEGGEKLGYYDPNKKEIAINNIGDKSTLMHEVQHAIQEIEGFAKGSGAKGKNYRLSHGEAEARNVQNRLNLGDKFRAKIVKDNNPVGDDYHAWIRGENDIKTFKQAYDDDGGGDLAPDFTEAMAKQAIDSGEITVYSSKPIKAGSFVTPSKMEAKSYAGSGEIYEEKLKLNDVSWLDALQGQVTRNKDIHPHETFDVNPDETIVSKDDMINLSKELEKKYILKDGSINEAAVRKEAEPFIEKEYSLENFKAEFPNGKVDTPIGEVSIESRQFNKLKFKGRENFLGLIKPTLERPAFVVDFEDTTFFFKPFRDKDGVIKFASVIKERDGGLDVVSNYPMKNRKFELITREGKVRYVQGSVVIRPLEQSLDDTVRSSAAKSPIEHSSDGKDIIPQNEEKIYHSRKIEEIKQEHPNVEKELDESIAAMRKESFNDVNFKDDLISKINAKDITTKQLGKSVDLSDKQLAVLKNDIKNADFKVISDSKIYFDKMGRDGDKKRFFIDIAEDGKVRVDGYSKKGIDTIPVRQSALEELAGVGDRARLKNMSFEVKAAYFNELDPIKKEAILKRAEYNALKKEMRGIYNVINNGKESTNVYKELQKIDEAIKLDLGSNKKGGGVHIQKHLDPDAKGAVSQQEVMNMGENMREYLKKYKEPFVDKDGGKIYEWQDKDGVRFRVAVYDKFKKSAGAGSTTRITTTDARENIITFYSDRNINARMEFLNPKVRVEAKFEEFKARNLDENGNIKDGLSLC